MSELKVNKISPRSGTDVTLGDSGDTFTVPAGASIVNNGTATGFGATGAVNWDTTAKTANFPAVSKVGYFVDTTLGAITVTLPATPSAGDIVGLVDYAGTFDTNALTIDPNGEDIEGSVGNFQLTGDREGVVLIYVDSTQGWLAISGINEGTDALSPAPYSIDFLVVAGGGAGGGQYWTGGGGAGGYRTSTQTVNIGTAITVTVGDGGAGNSSTVGASGSSSSISGSGLTTITSAGGGGGGNSGSAATSGGSGGGAYTIDSGAAGNTPSTVPSQGNNGGNGYNPGAPSYGGGGGGGAGQVGQNATSSTGGNGGNGSASSITGSSVTYAGGGGGGVTTGGTGFSTSSGGSGGGGNGAGDGGTGDSGTINTGSGGGGTGNNVPSSGTGGNGGKGVVILAMPLASFSNTTTGSPTESDDGTTKVLIFNGDGSYTA
jgi:hypothetical protein